MTYMERFIERNKEKSFVTNLMKYSELDEYGKSKVLSSILTHLLIDAEHGEDNSSYILDILGLLNKQILYKYDEFLPWFESKCNEM
jgi:hypothetical protein